MGPAEDRKLDQNGQNYEHTVNCIHDQKQTNSTATESSGQDRTLLLSKYECIGFELYI